MATTHATSGKTDLGADLVSDVADLEFGDIPDPVIDSVKLRILDYCAAAIAGVNADGITALRGLASRWGGRAEASVVGSSLRVPAPLAPQRLFLLLRARLT